MSGRKIGKKTFVLKDLSGIVATGINVKFSFKCMLCCLFSTKIKEEENSRRFDLEAALTSVNHVFVFIEFNPSGIGVFTEHHPRIWDETKPQQNPEGNQIILTCVLNPEEGNIRCYPTTKCSSFEQLPIRMSSGH